MNNLQPGPPPKPSLARRLVAIALGLAILALGGVLVHGLWLLHLPYVNFILGLGMGCLGLVLALVIGWKLMSAFLYKVGRRLAFSYFLLGVLPIPMVVLLLGVVGYLLSSFFLGHLYRDALRSLDTEVAAATRERAAIYQRTGQPPTTPAGGTVQGMAFAYYQNGRRVAGDPAAPAEWPSWVAEPAATASSPAASSASSASAGSASAAPLGSAASTLPSPLPRLYARANGSPALAATAESPNSGGGVRRAVLGFYGGDLDLELSHRSGLWVVTNRPGDPTENVQVKMGSREMPLMTVPRERNLGEAERFFKARARGEGWWDRPMLWCAQASGPLFDLTSGKRIAGSVPVTLNGTPATLRQHLFAADGEIDAASWGLLLGLAILLLNVYVMAALMALFMIVGLSRAVNRLSRATNAVRRGDFSVRIRVRRRDQVGELQRTFNEMAVNLETLVAASTQKELLEKELALARDLQNSLIPSNLPSGEGVEFATLFEPSAAIGGDYFDVLRLSERELAIIIADVSGHGLSTGLRMAMLKAALLILIEETRDPQELLRRLDGVVRANADGRCFVTATLANFDLRDGILTLTNAGHPPTYLVRGDKVEEILLPSSPLGGLGQRYARHQVALERGDIVVWLSDGVFEGVNPQGEPFGYDRVVSALATPTALLAAGGSGTGSVGGGAVGSAAAPGGRRSRPLAPTEISAALVRDRLLGAVAAHVGTEPPNDDRTVVVMRWGGPVGATAALAALPAGIPATTPAALLNGATPPAPMPATDETPA